MLPTINIYVNVFLLLCRRICDLWGNKKKDDNQGNKNQHVPTIHYVDIDSATTHDMTLMKAIMFLRQVWAADVNQSFCLVWVSYCYEMNIIQHSWHLEDHQWFEPEYSNHYALSALNELSRYYPNLLHIILHICTLRFNIIMTRKEWSTYCKMLSWIFNTFYCTLPDDAQLLLNTTKYKCCNFLLVYNATFEAEC